MNDNTTATLDNVELSAPLSDHQPVDPPTEPTRLELVQQGISALFDPTDVVEVRVPKARGGKQTISGYYSDHAQMANDISSIDGKHSAIYYLLNPANPALLSRAANRLKNNAATTTSDSDISRRTHLLIDSDPVRPAGISSTDEEKEYSRLQTRMVYKYLRDLHYPHPTVADSGNGFHLIYNIDLPNDKDAAELIKAVLKSLAARFDTPQSKIDTSVFNAARIVKAYGTLAAKGDSIADRPHRRSKVLNVGSGMFVTVEQLQTVAAETPSPASMTIGGMPGSITPEQIEQNLELCGVGHQEPVDGTKPGQLKWILDECPFNSDHIGKDAAVFLTDGIPGFLCFHDHCANNHWPEFRKKVEEVSSKRMVFNGGSVTVGKAGSNDLHISSYGLTEAGNGDLFVQRNKDHVRYCPSLNHAGWFVWDGQRWGQDPLKKVTEYARITMNGLLLAATQKYTAATDDAIRNEADAAMKWAKASLSHRRIMNMLALAGAGTELCVEGSVFDAHPELLNLQNGTLNLDTGEFYPARKEDLLTQIANVSYTPGASCALWKRFLDEVTEGDEEMQRYLQRVFGYMLTGDQREQCFFVFYGKGGTGKGTFWKTLEGMLGDYFATASIGLFVNNVNQAAGETASPAKAALAGKRVVVTSELDEGVRFNEPLLKLVTGGDSLTARHLYQPPFTFLPQCKPVFMTNHLPRTTDFSGGLEQRLRIVKFQRQFRNTTSEVKDLYRRFISEYDGILQWALAGLRELRETGLQEPESVKANVQEYMHSENAASRWMSERTVSCSDEILGLDAYNDFRHWAEQGNESCKRKANKWFYAQLADLGIVSEHSRQGLVLKGFRLTAPSLVVSLEHRRTA